jgi:hypothetical protein
MNRTLEVRFQTGSLLRSGGTVLSHAHDPPHDLGL